MGNPRYVIADPPSKSRASEWDSVFKELEETLPGVSVMLNTSELAAPSNLANRLKNRYGGFAVSTAKGKVYACFDGLATERRREMSAEDIKIHREKLVANKATPTKTKKVAKK